MPAFDDLVQEVDHKILTSAGVYGAEWWGTNPANVDNEVAINQAIAAIPEGSILVLPPHHLPTTAAIVINKPMRLTGHGAVSSVGPTGATVAFNVIVVDSSDVIVDNISAGGVTGDLGVGESCGIHIYDPRDHSNSDIQAHTNVRIQNCTIFDVDNGIRVGFQGEDATDELHISTRVFVTNNYIKDCRRTAIELFCCHHVIVESNICELIDRTPYDVSRAVRVCGAYNCTIKGNRFYGHDESQSGNYGVELGFAAPYSGNLAYLRRPGNILIEGNYFYNFNEFVTADIVIGRLSVRNNQFEGTGAASTQATHGVRITTALNAPYDDIKNHADLVVVEGNDAKFVGIFFRHRGQSDHIRVKSNVCISNNYASARFAFIDQPTEVDERLELLEIDDNTGITNEATGGGCIRVSNSKTGEQYYINRNRVSTATAVGTSGTTDGTVDSTGNVSLPTGLWTTMTT